MSAAQDSGSSGPAVPALTVAGLAIPLLVIWLLRCRQRWYAQHREPLLAAARVLRVLFVQQIYIYFRAPHFYRPKPVESQALLPALLRMSAAGVGLVSTRQTQLLCRPGRGMPYSHPFLPQTRA